MLKQYRAATNYVCDTVEANIKDGKLDFPESTFADSIFHYSKFIEFKSRNISDALTPVSEQISAPYYELKPGVGFFLVELAKYDCEFFDFLVHLCARNISACLSLEYPLNYFASRVLEQKNKRPRKAARPRKKDWMEKEYLWSITRELVGGYNLDITRNDETREKLSACDAVAEALTVCGRETKYTELKNLMVHDDHARRRKEFEVSEQIFSRMYDAKAPANALHPDYVDFWSKAAADAVLDIRGTFLRNE